MTNKQQRIWANVIPFNNQISSVWVYVVRPDATGPDDKNKIELSYNPQIQQYESQYYPFDLPGIYNIYIYAQDLKRNVSIPEHVKIVKFSDSYENDDTKDLSHVISIGDKQDRTFHHCNDIDVVKFYCLESQPRNQIDVITASTNKILMRIESAYHQTNEAEETIIHKIGYQTWTCDTNDMVYIELSPLNPQAYTETIHYELMLSSTSTGQDGRLEGKISDSFGRCLKNPIFKKNQPEDPPTYTIFPNGHYLMPLPSGIHTIISGINDKEFDRHEILIKERSTTIQHFSPPYCDLNIDGKITVRDAIIAFRIMAGEELSDGFTETCDSEVADIENIPDIQHLMFILKNISNFP